MSEATPWMREVRTQVALALPIILVQLGLFAMGAVDGAFMGRVSPVAYAATALGHSFTFTILAFGMGSLTVLEPVVSQAWGARDLAAIRNGVQRGLVLALGLSLLVAALIWPADRIFARLGQPEDVIPIATAYSRVIILSAPPFLLFVALRQASQAMHLLRPLVIVIVGANLLNAFLDWVLIFGHFGFPVLGAVGSAWGTVVARWAMIGGLMWLSGPELWRFLWPRSRQLLERGPLLRMLRIGLPVGFQWSVEVGAFAAVAMMMGKLGPTELAGHQVAMHLASASFMVPLGISMAAAVRVGNEIGRGDPSSVRRAAQVALAAGAAIMFAFGAVFLLVPYPLARIFTNLEDVLGIAVLLIPLAGAFQVFDGTQGVAAGVLRGLADTRVPMLIHVGGFWGIAIPVGLYLGFERDLGARGLWWGLVVGLAAVAAAQVGRVRVMLRRKIERVVIETAEP